MRPESWNRLQLMTAHDAAVDTEELADRQLPVCDWPEPPATQGAPEEGFCPASDDGQHCEHWWDCEPCHWCGFDGGGADCDEMAGLA